MFAAILRISLIFCCSWIQISYAATTAEKETASIKKITHKIAKWQSYITKNEKERDRLQSDLQKKEKAIQKTSTKLQELEQQISLQKNNLIILKKQQYLTQDQIQEQQSIFSEQLRNTFMLSQPSTLKILLYQKDPGKIGRQIILYRYLLDKKVALLEHLQDNLSMLEDTQKKIKKVNKELITLQKQARKTNIKLQKEQSSHQKLLRHVKQEILSGHTKVNSLQQEKAALEKLIANLQPRQVGIDADHNPQNRELPSRQNSIAHFKHRLPWPTHGQLKHRFGEPIEASDLSWQGIFIATPEGRAVHAIYPGKVVFADWLQGFGYMLILDHGDGYLSLYARNKMLRKKEGDLVRGQETIAQSGNTGGFHESGVYFELRADGKPVNPITWLKRG